MKHVLICDLCRFTLKKLLDSIQANKSLTKQDLHSFCSLCATNQLPRFLLSAAGKVLLIRSV